MEAYTVTILVCIQCYDIEGWCDGAPFDLEEHTYICERCGAALGGEE